MWRIWIPNRLLNSDIIRCATQIVEFDTFVTIAELIVDALLILEDQVCGDSRGEESISNETNID